MRGTNQIEKAIVSDGSRLRVHEIFYTLQGEMPFAGTPAVFVRLSGCNLRCTFCDTNFEGVNRDMSVHEVISEILTTFAGKGNPRLVVITGGEPLRQNIAPLTRSINEILNLDVQIETAGTLPLQGGSLLLYGPGCRNTVVCSPKTARLCADLLPFIRAYRYLIRDGECNEEDGLPIVSTQHEGKALRIARPHAPHIPVYVSPCDEFDPDKTRTSYAHAAAIAMKYGYRLSLQTHKIIDVP